MVLKVGGIAPLGAILGGKGANKTKRAVGGKLRLYLNKMSPNILTLCDGRQTYLSYWIGVHGMNRFILNKILKKTLVFALPSLEGGNDVSRVKRGRLSKKFGNTVLVKIIYCRDRQLIWLGDYFRKAAFSGWIDKFIWRYWVHCARCTV